MASNTYPVFRQDGYAGGVSVSTSSTTLTGASATDVFTAGSDGAEFYGLRIMAVTTTIDTIGYIYHDDGGTKRILGSVRITAIAPTNEQPAFSVDWTVPMWPLPMLIASGDKICFMPYTGSATFHVTPLGGHM